jgi:hypothetical protein
VGRNASAHVAEAVPHYENFYRPRTRECYDEPVRAGLPEDPDGVARAAPTVFKLISSRSR